MQQDLEHRLPSPHAPHFKSRGERRIADFLDSYSIHYQYEHGVYVTDQGKPRIWYPDFHLPEFATYVEYYGLAGDPHYDLGIQRKTAVYAANRLDVIPVYPCTFRDAWQRYIMDSLRHIGERRLETLAHKRHQRPQYRQGTPRSPAASTGYATRNPRTYRR